LPDGICIFKPKIPVWNILESLGMENVGILYDHFGVYKCHLEYPMAIW
jgi:hypothetical protein